LYQDPIVAINSIHALECLSTWRKPRGDGRKKENDPRDLPQSFAENDPLHAAAIRQDVSCQLLLVRLFIILRRLSFEGCGVFVSVEVFQFNGTTSQVSGF
jgi:hypothetical protein